MIERLIVLGFVIMLLTVGTVLGSFLEREVNPCVSVTQSRDINLPLLPEVAPMGGGGGNTF